MTREQRHNVYEALSIIRKLEETLENNPEETKAYKLLLNADMLLYDTAHLDDKND